MDSSERVERKGSLNQLLIGVLLAGLLAGAVVLGVQEAQRSWQVAARNQEPGSQAPGFEAERFGGGTFSLHEQRGKVVLLDFWATWCRPCVVEMPGLVKLAHEYEGKGLVFVAANRDDESERKVAVGLFVDEKVPGLGRHVVFADEPIGVDYGVDALPTLFLIDREGRIVQAATGIMPEARLRRWLEEAMANQPR